MIIRYLAKLILRIFDRTVALISDNKAYPKSDYLDQFRFLEAHTETIKREYLALHDQQVSGVSDVFIEQKKIADAHSWRSYMLTMFGYIIDQHAAKCPETTALIETEKISSAMFSVLKAGQRIKPHNGIYKGVIRAHLGLIVPDGECYINVDGTSYTWKEGEMVFLDDTFRHEACNNTEHDRVVLFLDIIRPLPFPFNKLNQWLFHAMSRSVFIQNVFTELNKEHEVTTTRFRLSF